MNAPDGWYYEETRTGRFNVELIRGGRIVTICLGLASKAQAVAVMKVCGARESAMHRRGVPLRLRIDEEGNGELS